MGSLARDKFKPTIFVGLGGNGGKIVDLMASKLRRHPHWSRISALTQFLVIDTNKDDLDKIRHVPPECRFLVSAFDRRAYIARKRGLMETARDELVTQWVPENYDFRGTQGAGAGQIRIESRLGLYYNLEDDVRAGMRRKLVRMLDDATRRENPWRDNEDRVVQVMLYASVAGGTGSGGFLPMSYLLRDAVLDNGWGRPSVVGMLSLPTTFLDKVKPQLQADIMANGYAALKELEYLTRQLGYEGGTKELEFHYDPGNRDRSRQVVRERPFSLCYLIDKPRELSIERFEHAVADASFLQIFTPLLGAQAGEYDNYDKHQKRLANGHFSVHYAAFGTSILHLPRRDVIKYSSLRFVARAFREYLCFGADQPAFRVPYGDPVWEQQDKATKDRDIDDKFLSYVAWRAEEERRANLKGVFTKIAANKGKDDQEIDAAFTARLSAVYERLAEKITIQDIDRQAINEGNPSIERQLNFLREDWKTSSGAVRAYQDAQITDLKSGKFLGSFFSDLEVNPIAQRFFLVKLLRQGFIAPTTDEADGFLAETAVSRRDIDGPLVQQEKARLHNQMSSALNRGFMGSMLDRENAKFNSAKAQAVRFYEDLAQEYRQELRRMFWRSFEDTLRNVASTLLTTFRNVGQLADRAARQASDETERFRADPGADPQSDVAQYYLDAEALRDDRRRERLWNVFYEHRLDLASNFDAGKIFDTVTSSFTPIRDTDGTLRDRDASEVVEAVRTGLMAQASGVFDRAMTAMGLDLAMALDLEQRYIALHADGKDPTELRRGGKLDDEVRAIARDRVERGVEDRLKRLAEECVLLANLDPAKADDTSVRPAYVFLAGAHASFTTDEPDCLGAVLKRAAPGITLLPDWTDRDAVVLYRGQLGVPVYWFRNVETVLQPAYSRVRDDATRSYPLHIEAAWEAGDGLPNLNPLDIRRAEEKRSQEDAARRARDERGSRIRSFELACLVGGVVDLGGSYNWSSSGATGVLGKDRVSAFAGWESLDPELRSDIEADALRAWREGTVDRGGRERLARELGAHAERLKGVYAQAKAAGRDQEARFVTDERAAVTALLAEVQAP
ncbi:MAG: hypothetical protein FJ102_07880 [Deltaproteobacteria bacterium]|nr:hypothetical protein [Deltaproteobacteria bacterium]